MTLARRAAALALSLLVLLPAALAAGETRAAPLSTVQKQEDLDFLYDTLKEVHPALFANTSEADFQAKKAEIEGALDGGSDLDFALGAQSLTALVKDSHTTSQYSGVDNFRFFPFSVLWFEGAWRLAAVDSAYSETIGQTVTAVNGVEMDRASERFARFVSADNPVKLRRQMGQLLYVADILEHLELIQPGGSLTLTLRDADGAVRNVALSPLTAGQLREASLASVSALRAERSATAYDKRKYYFSLPLDEGTYYIQYNRCQADPDLPMADFAARVAADLEAGAYRQVLLDLRNNGGGSDGVIRPLLDMLAPKVRDGSLRLWGLIGETTYSSAVINAVMIPEMGGYLAGTPTSGSVDHFGTVRSFSLPNSGLAVNYSTKWIDLATLLEAAIPYGVESLTPHVSVEPTWADYLAGKDTEVEYLLAHGLEYETPDRGGEDMTRGYLLSLLREAARAAGKDVSAPESPFRDAIPFAYYAPAADWAALTGIAAGNGDGSLEPARPVTRAEAAVTLSRFADYMGLSPAARQAPFSDEQDIPAWALDAARRASALGLSDTASAAFRPGGTMTRSEGEALVRGLRV